MEKFLTIIVAAFNVDKYLRKGCESCVLGSPWCDMLDVIIVNDGSTDNSSMIAHEFERFYPHVFRVIDKQNGHYGSCVNRGLALAQGRYVKILDGDDSFDVQGLKALVERLVFWGEDGPDVIYCDCDWINATGEVVETARLNFEDGAPFKLLDLSSIDKHIGHPQLVYRTAMLVENNYQQTEGCAYTDIEYYTLPLLWCRSFRYVRISPMRILVEREGRSMATATYAKQFGTVAKLTIGLVKQWNRWKGQCPHENYEYVGSILLKQVQAIYSSCISGICGVLPSVDLGRFDTELKACDLWFYNSVESVTRFYGFKLNLVGEWRRTHDINSWRLLVWRKYVNFIANVAKLKHFLLVR